MKLVGPTNSPGLSHAVGSRGPLCWYRVAYLFLQLSCPRWQLNCPRRQVKLRDPFPPLSFPIDFFVFIPPLFEELPGASALESFFKG
eukprot:613874-Pelagomonas_calceolata.AAC.1